MFRFSITTTLGDKIPIKVTYLCDCDCSNNTVSFFIPPIKKNNKVMWPCIHVYKHIFLLHYYRRSIPCSGLTVVLILPSCRFENCSMVAALPFHFIYLSKTV